MVSNTFEILSPANTNIAWNSLMPHVATRLLYAMYFVLSHTHLYGRHCRVATGFYFIKTKLVRLFHPLEASVGTYIFKFKGKGSFVFEVDNFKSTCKTCYNMSFFLCGTLKTVLPTFLRIAGSKPFMNSKYFQVLFA